MDLSLNIHVFLCMVVCLAAAALYEVHKGFLRNAYRGDDNQNQDHQISAYGSDNGDQAFRQKAADQTSALSTGRGCHIDIHDLSAGAQPCPKQEFAESAE